MGLHESSTGEKISPAKKSVTKKREKKDILEEHPQMGHDALYEGGLFKGNKTDS